MSSETMTVRGTTLRALIRRHLRAGGLYVDDEVADAWATEVEAADCRATSASVSRALRLVLADAEASSGKRPASASALVRILSASSRDAAPPLPGPDPACTHGCRDGWVEAGRRDDQPGAYSYLLHCSCAQGQWQQQYGGRLGRQIGIEEALSRGWRLAPQAPPLAPADLAWVRDQVAHGRGLLDSLRRLRARARVG